jgi:nucleotide-binding universal stress UspA family protein
VLKQRGLDDLQRILVPWGGGWHARLGLEIAVRIAAATGARVDVLRITREDVDAAREEAAVRDDVEALTDTTGVDLGVIVTSSDDVPGTIVDTARHEGHDLVVIGASGETRLRTVLFGTIPDVVADEAPCSVLLVQRFVPEHWAYRASDRLKRLRERAGMTSSAE